MTKTLVSTVLFMAITSAHAQQKPAPVLANAPANDASTSIQQILVSGPPQLKMHSLAMLTQGKAQQSIDESFLPGFKVCSEDVSPPIRGLTARLLGEHFVKEKTPPNSNVVEVLIKLARDENKDVRYNAVYYGLCNMAQKDETILTLLIDVAIDDRNPNLHERIIQSLEENKEQVREILERKLAEGDNVAVFEIYENFTGKQPPNLDKYLDMPSSRPRMFIIKGSGDNADEMKAELIKELQAVGIKSPQVHVSGVGKHNILTVKTYITKEGMAVEKNFSKDGKFQITQQMWLTPELEVQLEAMRKARQAQQQ